jgi:hypothetical protein
MAPPLSLIDGAVRAAAREPQSPPFVDLAASESLPHPCHYCRLRTDGSSRRPPPHGFVGWVALQRRPARPECYHDGEAANLHCSTACGVWEQLGQIVLWAGSQGTVTRNLTRPVGTVIVLYGLLVGLGRFGEKGRTRYPLTEGLYPSCSLIARLRQHNRALMLELMCTRGQVSRA